MKRLTHCKKIISLIVFTMTANIFLTGMSLEARSASATITVDGETRTIRASGEPLSVLLEREGIILGEHDEISCPADERITDGMNVVIDRVEFVERTTSEPVPYKTVYTETTLAKIGTSYVKTEGVNGRLDTTVVDKIVNGKTEYSYVSVTNEIPPVNEEVAFGTALQVPYSKKEGDFSLKNGVPTEYEYCLSGKVTAYTAPAGAGTYSGRKLEIGTIGVDPDVIPFGSEVYICSKDGKMVYGYAIAADTGDITEIIADVFMGTTADNYDDACRWGAQDAYVYVLSVGDNSVSWM